jgi:phage-related tail protein
VRLDDVAAAMRSAGEELGTAGAALAELDPGPPAFGVDAPGRLGELGRVLHATCAVALTARSREATALGARLSDSAYLVRAVAASYRDVEQSAHDRHGAQET